MTKNIICPQIRLKKTLCKVRNPNVSHISPFPLMINCKQIKKSPSIFFRNCLSLRENDLSQIWEMHILTISQFKTQEDSCRGCMFIIRFAKLIRIMYRPKSEMYANKIPQCSRLLFFHSHSENFPCCFTGIYILLFIFTSQLHVTRLGGTISFNTDLFVPHEENLKLGRLSLGLGAFYSICINHNLYYTIFCTSYDSL